jgi:hypothetical protein
MDMAQNENTPTMEEWKRLYELIEQVKQLAPWKYMLEDEIFGYEMPATGELGFVSVMGNLGEHFAVAVYQGTKGLNGFLYIHEMGDEIEPESILQIPQLQASFEGREYLSAEERKIIKTLGLKFRGENAWPQFRGFRPNYFPWYIEGDEARMLICGLEQLLDVAPRFKENPDILMPTGLNDDYLLRVQKDGQWQDMIWKNPGAKKDKPIDMQISAEDLAQLKSMMPGNFIIEFDLYKMDEPFQDKKNDRPYFPYMFMLADHDSGMILAVDLMKPHPTLETMMQQIPLKIINALTGFPPKEIQVKNQSLYSLLTPLGEHVGFKANKVARLSSMERAKREMRKFSRGVGF